jgi:hypothetical protein
MPVLALLLLNPVLLVTHVCTAQLAVTFMQMAVLVNVLEYETVVPLPLPKEEVTIAAST